MYKLGIKKPFVIINETSQLDEVKHVKRDRSSGSYQFNIGNSQKSVTAQTTKKSSFTL